MAVPIKTSVEDIDKLIAYMNKQVGWVEFSKLQKSLGNTATDDRKIAAMVTLGLIERDGSNIKLARRGQRFAAEGRAVALRDAIANFELYYQTVEWLHYSKRAEITSAEVGQYWENSHKDTLGGLKGSTLKDGAVSFGRIVDGAELGKFILGRAGKETRMTVNLESVAKFLDGESKADDSDGVLPGNSQTAAVPLAAENDGGVEGVSSGVPHTLAVERRPQIEVSASPSVHVNVEIHIAADATAGTIKEIFKNMARYVLDKSVVDDVEQ